MNEKIEVDLSLELIKWFREAVRGQDNMFSGSSIIEKSDEEIKEELKNFSIDENQRKIVFDLVTLPDAEFEEKINSFIFKESLFEAHATENSLDLLPNVDRATENSLGFVSDSDSFVFCSYADRTSEVPFDSLSPEEREDRMIAQVRVNHPEVIRERLYELINYAESYLLQYSSIDTAPSMDDEICTLASRKGVFHRLLSDSIQKFETEKPLSRSLAFSDLLPQQKEQLYDKLNKFKKQRQIKQTKIDEKQLRELKDTTLKFNEIRKNKFVHVPRKAEKDSLSSDYRR
ncbi:hypothetical protein AALA44_01935 [Enterococcus ratti]|uniref:hypothetical protein n=1 Tax=Enterococcus ratti TaxID=150033 RepID=UPI003516D89F